MPLTMTGFSFIGIAVTSATIVEFGEPIWDPVALVARLLADLPILLDPRDDRDRHRADLDEHGGQRGVAVERLLEPLAAPDLVPHRRADHRGDRDRLVPVEALRGRRRLHLHLARRLRQPAGLVPRRDGVRLLAAAARPARRGGALPLRPRRPLLVLGRVQLARAGRGRDRRDPGPAGLHPRRHDEGRRRRRPGLPRPALPLRRVRGLRAVGDLLRGVVLRAGRRARRRSRPDGLRRDVPDRPAAAARDRADAAGRAARLHATRGRSTPTSSGRSRTSSTRRCSPRPSGSPSARS